MEHEKPKCLDEYKCWLREKHGVELDSREESYYTTVAGRVKEDFEQSVFWKTLWAKVLESNEEYLVKTGYPLLLHGVNAPTLCVKPYESFLLKTYRKNVLRNDKWPEPPGGGWVLPTNWLSRVGDIVRTLVEVKYMDGVKLVLTRMTEFCKSESAPCSGHLEAREEGYYAAHLNLKQTFEVPRRDWDTQKVDVSIEIQITTQLQEVIRRLLHKYYERNRAEPKAGDPKAWKWDYRHEEFSANYLGHILHYVEGMILEIRDRQREKERMR